MAFISGTIMALQNLTRIYIFNLDFEEEKFGRSTAYFPIVGIVIGIFLYSINAVSIKHFSPLVTAALLLGGHLIITGGMHLDGFMDSMDGLFSGRQKERKLEIMKDSRVGANGVMALVIILLLKFALLVSLVQINPKVALGAFIIMATLSRWAMVYAIRYFPYLTKEGLGKLYKIYTGTTEVIISTILAVMIAFLAFGLWGLIIFTVIWLCTHLIAKQISKTIGGMTGDTYGAIAELMEVAILFTVMLSQ